VAARCGFRAPARSRFSNVRDRWASVWHQNAEPRQTRPATTKQKTQVVPGFSVVAGAGFELRRPVSQTPTLGVTDDRTASCCCNLEDARAQRTSARLRVNAPICDPSVGPSRSLTVPRERIDSSSVLPNGPDPFIWLTSSFLNLACNTRDLDVTRARSKVWGHHGQASSDGHRHEVAHVADVELNGYQHHRRGYSATGSPHRERLTARSPPSNVEGAIALAVGGNRQRPEILSEPMHRDRDRTGGCPQISTCGADWTCAFCDTLVPNSPNNTHTSSTGARDSRTHLSRLAQVLQRLPGHH
jgi:hypothetical protein